MSRSTSHQSQITLRSLDPRLAQEIRRVAREDSISLDEATLKLLRKGAGLQERRTPNVVGHSLDHLIGTWDETDAKQFWGSIRSCEHPHQHVWIAAHALETGAELVTLDRHFRHVAGLASPRARASAAADLS